VCENLEYGIIHSHVAEVAIGIRAKAASGLRLGWPDDLYRSSEIDCFAFEPTWAAGSAGTTLGDGGAAAAAGAAATAAAGAADGAVVAVAKGFALGASTGGSCAWVDC